MFHFPKFRAKTEALEPKIVSVDRAVELLGSDEDVITACTKLMHYFSGRVLTELPETIWY